MVVSRVGWWRTVVPATVAAGLSLSVVLSRSGEWWGQWRPTVDWWATSALLVFPVAALCGALRGVATRRNGRALLAATSSRSALITTSRDLVDGILPVVAGYLVVLTGVLIATGTSGPWGWPPLLECVAYVVALIAVGTLGYAAGSLLPYPAVPAIAAVIALVVPFGLTYASAWENLMPPVSSYGPFYYPPNSFLLMQLSFFAAVGAVGVFAASRHRVLAVTAVVVVLPIAFVLAPLRGTSVARQDLQASMPQCRQLARVQICVARAQTNQLNRLATLVNPLGPLLAARFPAGVTLAASGVEIAKWTAFTYGIKPIRGNAQFAALPGASASDLADRLVALPTAQVVAWIGSPGVRAGIRTCAPASETEFPT